MKREPQGTQVRCSMSPESYFAYLPNPLPPKPDIDYEAVAILLESANHAMGELNGVLQAAPLLEIINYMYIRKEAVLSSQIEGTQSTLDELLRYEADQVKGVSLLDVEEVSTYVAALQHGMNRLASGFPLSIRLMNEIHAVLLSNTRGHNKSPGAFRTSQNWIGGTRPGNARFVPPPPHLVMECMGDLEKFIHEQDGIPTLIKAALIHVQFETIHPFLDGNGRLGRLLITFFLWVQGTLKSPALYLSLFFKKHQQLYYSHLNQIRHDGDWESWLVFFLEGVIETARDAKETILTIQQLFKRHEAAALALGRASASAQLVLQSLQRKPIQSVASLVRLTGLSKPTVIKSINHLVELEIVRPQLEKKWGQIYAYQGLLDVLNDNE